MIVVTLKDWFTPDDFKLCEIEAKERLDQQIEDASKSSKASYSYGRKSKMSSRPYNKRLEDHLIGAKAEFLISKLFGCEWTRERQQYLNAGAEPDLKSIFRGNEIGIEVQGSRMTDIGIVRPRDFKEWKSGRLLAVVTPLPNSPTVKVGYKSFSELNHLCQKNPQWMRAKDSKSPYYAVPIDFFDFDFNDFLK